MSPEIQKLFPPMFPSLSTMSPEIQKLVSGLAKPSAVQKSRNTLGFWILDDGNGLITRRKKNGGLGLVADGDE